MSIAPVSSNYASFSPAPPRDLRALFEAIERQDLSEVRNILSGFTPDEVNQRNETRFVFGSTIIHPHTSALYWAVEKGNAEIVQLLIDAKADVDLGGYGRNAPLVEASRRGDLPIVELLLRAGADVNIMEAGYITPLHVAAYDGHTEVVTRLLQAGAEKNATAKYHQTPLYFATEEGHVAAVQALCRAGADCNIPCLVEGRRDGHRRTPLGTAMRYEYYEVARALLRAGANPLNKEEEEGLSHLITPGKEAYQAILREIRGEAIPSIEGKDSSLFPKAVATWITDYLYPLTKAAEKV